MIYHTQHSHWGVAETKEAIFLKLIEFQTRKFLIPALRYANSVGWFLNEDESFKPLCPDYMFFQIAFTHEYLHARVSYQHKTPLLIIWSISFAKPWPDFLLISLEEVTSWAVLG